MAFFYLNFRQVAEDKDQCHTAQISGLEVFLLIARLIEQSFVCLHNKSRGNYLLKDPRPAEQSQQHFYLVCFFCFQIFGIPARFLGPAHHLVEEHDVDGGLHRLMLTLNLYKC